MKLNLKKLILSIALPLLAGFLGSLTTITGEGSWYMTLNKPSFNPPGWLFGPVWTVLYILMGISAYLIWVKINTSNNRPFDKLRDRKSKNALIFFWVQLVLNATWSWAFFGAQNPRLAFLNIVILWIFILLTIIKFYRIDRRASYLLIPYILWVSFASMLNYFIWMLN